MAKRFTPDISSELEHTPSQFLSGTNLSEIKQVERHNLRPNPKNTEYFSQESAEYFERLEQDIRERGIIVPLLAKEDGTLLAGHNRLVVAEKLKIKFVPVQYVKKNITEREEQEFVIKDNLFRRQLSGSEWIDVYRKLYPDFDTLLSNEKSNGRQKAGALTANKIAKDTGQKVEAVRKQLQRGKVNKLDTVQLVKNKQTAKKNNNKLDTVQLTKENSNGTDNMPEFVKREAFNALASIKLKFTLLSAKDRVIVRRSVEKLLKDLQTQE